MLDIQTLRGIHSSSAGNRLLEGDKPLRFSMYYKTGQNDGRSDHLGRQLHQQIFATEPMLDLLMII